MYSRLLKWGVQVKILLNSFKHNTTLLSLLVGTTAEGFIQSLLLYLAK